MSNRAAGWVWKTVKVFLVGLQILTLFYYPMPDRKMLRMVVRVSMVTYALSVGLADSFFAYDTYLSYDKNRSDKFSVVVIGFFTTVLSVIELPHIPLMWRSSAKLVRLVRSLDGEFGSLLTLVDRRCLTFGLIIWIIGILTINGLFLQYYGNTTVFSADVNSYQEYFTNVERSMLSVLFRFYSCALQIADLGKEVLSGLIMFLALVCGLMFQRTVTLGSLEKAVIRHAALTSVVKEMDSCLGLIVAVRCIAMLGWIIVATFNISGQYANCGAPASSTLLSLVTDAMILCLTVLACLFSTEQSQLMIPILELHLEEQCRLRKLTDEPNDRWMVLYLKRIKYASAGFTIAGIKITRESTFQGAAALLGSILVFTQLAGDINSNFICTPVNNRTSFWIL